MSTESLIAELAMKARPVKHVPHSRICVEWMAITLASLTASCWVSGLRPDLAMRLSEPLFLMEITLNAMLILVAGCTATAFSYPDRAKAPLLKPMLLMIFMGYSFIAAVTMLHGQEGVTPTTANAHHGLECLLCILSFAAIPAMWMFWRLRHLASVKPMQAGGAALMMAVAVGCLGVRLVEHEVESAEMLMSHYLPLIVLSGLGLMLGNRLFKW